MRNLQFDHFTPHGSNTKCPAIQANDHKGIDYKYNIRPTILSIYEKKWTTIWSLCDQWRHTSLPKWRSQRNLDRMGYNKFCQPKAPMFADIPSWGIYNTDLWEDIKYTHNVMEVFAHVSQLKIQHLEASKPRIIKDLTHVVIDHTY